MRLLSATAALAGGLALAACGPAQGDQAAAAGADAADADPAAALSPTERAAMEQVVRDYILENPELIEEALIELQLRAREREVQAMANAVAQNAEALKADPRDPRLGAAEPELVVVEFFDYRCPYCRVTNQWVVDALEAHGDRVQFVFKEWPVLGEQSRLAARAALAAWEQGPDVYGAFHNALMRNTGPLPLERLEALALDAGVDVERMRADMEAEAVDETLADVSALASEIGLTGTPFFVVGDQVVPGADTARLNRLLQERLEG